MSNSGAPQIPDDVRDLAKKIVKEAQEKLVSLSGAGRGTKIKVVITLPSNARLTVSTEPKLIDWCADPNPSDSVYQC